MARRFLATVPVTCAFVSLVRRSLVAGSIAFASLALVSLVLVSPSLLFRIEQAPPGKEARPVNDWEIATRLSVSEATVKVHVGRILAKLGLRDRVEVVIFAYETGLIRPGE